MRRIALSALADDLCADILFDEPLHLVVGAHNRWAHQMPIGLVDLASKSWVLAPANTAVHDPVEAAFVRQGLPPLRPNVTIYSMNLRM